MTSFSPESDTSVLPPETGLWWGQESVNGRITRHAPLCKNNREVLPKSSRINLPLNPRLASKKNQGKGIELLSMKCLMGAENDKLEQMSSFVKLFSTLDM